MMMSLYLYIRTWLQSQKSEEGQDLVEYALLLALIAIVAIAGITAAGVEVEAVWDRIGEALTALQGLPE